MYEIPAADAPYHEADAPPPIICPVEAAAEDAKVDAFLGGNSARRRNSVSAQAITEDRMRQFQAPVHPKSPEHAQRIRDCIAWNDKLQVLFGHLSAAAMERVVGAFFYRPVQEGDIIIQQGADGDFFYLVDSGVFDIFVQRRVDVPAERVMQAFPGMGFGELALMYNVPRAATVRSAQLGGLWCLDRESFQMMLVTAENSKKSEYDGFLANVPLLSELTHYERSILSDLLDSEPFDPGEAIVTQGEMGTAFYFLYEGECKAFILGHNGEVEVKHYMQPGEYFGEVALLHDEPRRATVRACGEGCVVLRLEREDVDMSVGGIWERLQTSSQSYASYEAFFPQH